MRLRRWFYQKNYLRSIKLPIPVVVVGGIFVGGTGKTPLILCLLEQLGARGWQVGVVSRGYGSNSQTARLVTAQMAASLVGDEAALIYRSTGRPIAVASNRVAAAQLLLDRHPEINLILADDGLQHLRLARDVEIAVMDGRGLGNGLLLPAGPLREAPTRLGQVDAIVLRDAGAVAASEAGPPRFAMQTNITHLRHLLSGTTLAPAEFATRFAQRLAAAGIGYPAQFFAGLAATGLSCETLALPDHFAFDNSPFPVDPALAIIVTEKDAVKMAHLVDQRVWVAQAHASVDSNLLDLIEHIVKESRGSQTA